MSKSIFSKAKAIHYLIIGIIMFLSGLLLSLDTLQERGLEDADLRFGDRDYCFFPLLKWVRPVTLPIAGVLYSLMWGGECLSYYLSRFFNDLLMN